MMSTYRDLQGQLLSLVVGLNGVENSGKLLAVELDCTNTSEILTRSNWVDWDSSWDGLGPRKRFSRRRAAG